MLIHIPLNLYSGILVLSVDRKCLEILEITNNKASVFISKMKDLVRDFRKK